MKLAIFLLGILAVAAAYPKPGEAPGCIFSSQMLCACTCILFSEHVHMLHSRQFVPLMVLRLSSNCMKQTLASRLFCTASDEKVGEACMGMRLGSLYIHVVSNVNASSIQLVCMYCHNYSMFIVFTWQQHPMQVQEPILPKI